MLPLRPGCPLGVRLLALPSRVPVVTSVRGITFGENDAINPTLTNRNPRNMEMLRLARKPQGWHLEASSRTYWYKLMLEKSNRHSTAWVEHHTGSTVVSASTREWAIKQHLYSTTDINAVYNIGRVLARRCLESGITEMYTELDRYAESSKKVQKFLSALEEEGVELTEPRFINELSVDMFSIKRPALPWQVQEEEEVVGPSQDSPPS